VPAPPRDRRGGRRRRSDVPRDRAQGRVLVPDRSPAGQGRSRADAPGNRATPLPERGTQLRELRRQPQREREHGPELREERVREAPRSLEVRGRHESVAPRHPALTVLPRNACPCAAERGRAGPSFLTSPPGKVGAMKRLVLALAITVSAALAGDPPTLAHHPASVRE